jgi:hypothetical protein
MTDPATIGARVLAGLPAAARELRVSVPTLRRWLRAGAPVAHRGRRGRGGQALIDPAAVAAWRGSGKAEHGDLIVFANELPELVAGAIAESFQHIEGPHKRLAAGALAGAWYLITVALLDRLRCHVPELRDPDVLPREIDHLRSIYRDSGRTDFTDSPGKEF